MIENGRTWDLVIADPPKFIHGREDEIGTAQIRRPQQARPATRRARTACSSPARAPACSARESSSSIVITSAHRRNKRLQTFDRTGAGPDHPTLSNYPESRYLKVLWSRVI